MSGTIEPDDAKVPNRATVGERTEFAKGTPFDDVFVDTGRCRIFRGDPDQLVEVPSANCLKSSDPPQAEAESRSLTAEFSLDYIFDSLVRDGDDVPEAIGAVVFADTNASAADCIELSLSAAGTTNLVEARRVFTGDTTPTGLRSLRTWALEQMSLRAAYSPDLSLVVSELVTNVERYAPGWVMVDLVFRTNEVLVSVTDQEVNSLPQLGSCGVDDESGRGLSIVATLSTAWGVVRGPGSKAVWSLLRCDYDVA